jgi:hypothetical protein
MHETFKLENLRGKDDMKALGMHGTIIKRNVWTRLIWHRIWL